MLRPALKSKGIGLWVTAIQKQRLTVGNGVREKFFQRKYVKGIGSWGSHRSLLRRFAGYNNTQQAQKACKQVKVSKSR